MDLAHGRPLPILDLTQLTSSLSSCLRPLSPRRQYSDNRCAQQRALWSTDAFRVASHQCDIRRIEARRETTCYGDKEAAAQLMKLKGSDVIWPSASDMPWGPCRAS